MGECHSVPQKYQILSKKILASGIKPGTTLPFNIIEINVFAPVIAKQALAGQFVIIMNRENGERIPLTIAGCDSTKGTITLTFQEVGKTTYDLGENFQVGDSLYAVSGPLGRPSGIALYNHPEGRKIPADDALRMKSVEELQAGDIVCLVLGGVGVAPELLIARELRQDAQKRGYRVYSIIGARESKLLIYKDEIQAASDELRVTLDEEKRLVTHELEELLRNSQTAKKVKLVYAIGPPIMMQKVNELCSKYSAENNINIRLIVSLNPIMVDGTGMCGGCRVSLKYADGSERPDFACVNGPEYELNCGPAKELEPAALVGLNWEVLSNRLSTYVAEERQAMEHFFGDSGCRLGPCEMQKPQLEKKLKEKLALGLKNSHLVNPKATLTITHLGNLGALSSLWQYLIGPLMKLIDAPQITQRLNFFSNTYGNAFIDNPRVISHHSDGGYIPDEAEQLIVDGGQIFVVTGATLGLCHLSTFEEIIRIKGAQRKPLVLFVPQQVTSGFTSQTPWFDSYAEKLINQGKFEAYDFMQGKFFTNITNPQEQFPEIILIWTKTADEALEWISSMQVPAIDKAAPVLYSCPVSADPDQEEQKLPVVKFEVTTKKNRDDGYSLGFPDIEALVGEADTTAKDLL
ncbi:MAG: sulfide/dihydroorotate dehydrogenase-like FAD/NAD-binding protein, partial [Candidatus Omnitrophica bacterium]|nr:sulfide/dihydroorotate dehydrogenase-like FAD/NAD-binding protein [Candidatus Omnitrophota bacterium]